MQTTPLVLKYVQQYLENSDQLDLYVFTQLFLKQLIFRSRSFGHYPEFVTIGEGREVDRPLT